MVSVTSNPAYTPGGKFPEVTRWINRPFVKRVFYRKMLEMTRPGAPFTREFLQPFVTELQRIGMNANGPLSFIGSRSNALRTRVAGVSLARAPFGIRTNGGDPITSEESSVTLGVQAPVDVATIRVLVDGEEAQFPVEVEFSRQSVVGADIHMEMPAGRTRFAWSPTTKTIVRSPRIRFRSP